MEKAEKALSVKLKTQLNSGIRRYVCSEKMKDTLEKEFKYLEQDIKLKRFAADEIGMVSDCYLLYAVACLGVADIESIAMFDTAVYGTDAGLHIMDVNNSDYLRNRLEALMINGLLFKMKYVIDTFDEDGNPRVTHNSFYIIEKDGLTFMNRVLSKRVVGQSWLVASNPYELIGNCAAGYVAGMLSRGGKFLEFKQGIFSTKAIGTVFIPSIVKLELSNGEPIYVGVIDAFLHRYEITQTKGDYEDRCIFKVNTIKQYLYHRDSRDNYAAVVVTVEDNKDLNEIAYWIGRVGNLSDDYDRIFFTGEGIFRHNDIKKKKKLFLKMKELPGDKGIEFVPVEPEFL